MGKGFVWATVEDLAKNKPRVLSLYRHYLRALASERLGLSLIAQETKRVQVRELFNMGARERSVHNIRDLIGAAKNGDSDPGAELDHYALSFIIMCGIALCLSGVKIEGHLAATAGLVVSSPHNKVPILKGPSIEDLCEALKRRGPDNLHTKTLHVQAAQSASELAPDNCRLFVCNDDKIVNESRLEETCSSPPTAKIAFAGALLQLRGDHPVPQPLKDSSGNILIYNGEIFGGLPVPRGNNDTELLFAALKSCCSCACHGSPVTALCSCTEQDSTNMHKTVPSILSSLRGPWALVFWQAENQILWIGRDVLGRRSLIMHRPSLSDSRLLLASVAPVQKFNANEKDGNLDDYWEELTCGIHSISLKAEKSQEVAYIHILGCTQLHKWEDPLLHKLISWDRQFINPNSCVGPPTSDTQQGNETVIGVPEINLQSEGRGDPGLRLLNVLRQSVQKRTSDIKRHHQSSTSCDSTQKPVSEEHAYAPVAVLFSGGLDSMILAALVDECLQPHYSWGMQTDGHKSFAHTGCIDLLNVSFEGATAPDRITAIAGLGELQRISPQRRWRLVKVDANLAAMNSNRPQLQSLIRPANTYMDLNIGTALWLAARGQGSLHVTEGLPGSPGIDGENLTAGTEYISSARVLLVGAGADEQCGGYGRHRTKFRLGGWESLQAEMRIDMQRIWKRNLGRDDRCMADSGKEARFPFLDEEVVETLLDMPLWDIVDLQQPIGYGDKKVLRAVAMTLGLTGAAILPKRAIQFGSRIARESNKMEFGSNRAANQASAGSAVLPGLVQS